MPEGKKKKKHMTADPLQMMSSKKIYPCQREAKMNTETSPSTPLDGLIKNIFHALQPYSLFRITQAFPNRAASETVVFTTLTQTELQKDV